MAVINLATAVKNSMLVPLGDAIDAGVGAGTIKIYTAPMAAAASSAIGVQVLLGTLTFGDPCGSVEAGALTMNTITQDPQADATGTAGWARIADSAGNTVADIDVTVTGGGGALQLNTTSIVKDGPILITSFVFSL